MKKSNIVINTLVYLNELKNGERQSNLLKQIHSLGMSKAEVRREFISNFQTELQEIRVISEELQMELFYSVPSYLYVESKLNVKDIEQSFYEASIMKCRNVKFNIGDYTDISAENVYKLNSLCDKYSVKLTVENDQTEENGQVDKIYTFLQSAQSMGMKVSCTFDIGNWLWQKEDPIENSYKLKPYVTYIHLKDAYVKDKPEATLLGQGVIPWRSILEIFDKSIPVAIEYPCSPDTYATLKEEINKLQEIISN